MEVEPKVDINKRTKLTASALAAVLVVGSMGLTATSASAAPQVDPDLNYCMEHRKPFSDVDSSTPHATDIQWMYCNAITTGFRDPGSYPATYSYRGMDTVIRQDMAAFIRRMASRQKIGNAASWKPSASDWSRFRDVDKSTPHAEDVLWLAQSGISTGWRESDGSYTFRPTDTVKRQDMAAFLYRLARLGGVEVDSGASMAFSDVTSSTPHAKEIRWLGGVGISTGWKNTNGTSRFQGMSSTVRQDMAAFMHRTSDVIANANESDWPVAPSSFVFDFEATYKYGSGEKFLYQMTDSWVDYKDKYGKTNKPQLHLVFKITNTGTKTDRPFSINIKSFQNKIRTDSEYISFFNEIQPGGVAKNYEMALELEDLDTPTQLIVDDSSYDFVGTTVIDNLDTRALLVQDSKDA